VATRTAYGRALRRIYPGYPDLVCLDAEVSNSTMAELFKDSCPERFFEMYVAEQNMVGAALGFARRGKIPFVSTFAAFMSRAYDQIRMSRIPTPISNLSVPMPGFPSARTGQARWALRISPFSVPCCDGVVLYPADAVSTERLVEEAARHRGVVYIRTTRGATPVIYGSGETFPIGGCKVLHQSKRTK
jgi:transketolase